MQRQVQVAAALLLVAGACKKEPAPAAAPYALTTARDGDGLRVEVKTSGEYHVNDEYPVSFSPDDGGRLQLKDAVTKSACAGDATVHCAAAIPVPNAAGTLAFSVCSKDNCLIEKVAIAPVR